MNEKVTNQYKIILVMVEDNEEMDFQTLSKEQEAISLCKKLNHDACEQMFKEAIYFKVILELNFKKLNSE